VVIVMMVVVAIVIVDTAVNCFQNSFQAWLLSQQILKTWSGWLISTHLSEIWYIRSLRVLFMQSHT